MTANFKELKECKQTFQNAIAENFDGMHLNPEFIDDLILRYGLETLLYLCALTIAAHDWDGRYSRRNKEWAKSIKIKESESARWQLELNTHPAVLDGVTDILLKRTEINFLQSSKLHEKKSKKQIY